MLGAERNIFGRAGKVYRQLFDPLTGKVVGTSDWILNATEITATMTVDRLEVRRAGSYFVHYKAGEITGEGTLTIDKVNSEFEAEFIDFINGRSVHGEATKARVLPMYYLYLNLEDPGMPDIKFDAAGDATENYERVVLKNVNFWTMPFGFGLGDMVTRDLDFTFSGIDFATGTKGASNGKPLKINEPGSTRRSDPSL